MCWILKHDTFNQKKSRRGYLIKYAKSVRLSEDIRFHHFREIFKKCFFSIKCLVVSMLDVRGEIISSPGGVKYPVLMKKSCF